MKTLTLAAIAALSISAAGPKNVTRGFYLSPSTKACVRQPTFQRLPGAVAFCADEKFSYALDPSEACAGPHGRVVKWVRTEP
jgi:hypothetical protein